MTSELSERSRQIAHAAAVRNRLLNPQRVAPPPPHYSQDALQTVLKELGTANVDLANAKAELESMERRNSRLQRTNADLRHALDIATAKIKAMEAIKHLVSFDEKPIEEIVAPVIAKYEGVTWADVISPRRGGRDVTQCRHECMHAVKMQRTLSYPAIAMLFNRSCHTTVMHAVRSVEQRLNAEKRKGGKA